MSEDGPPTSLVSLSSKSLPVGPAPACHPLNLYHLYINSRIRLSLRSQCGQFTMVHGPLRVDTMPFPICFPRETRTPRNRVNVLYSLLCGPLFCAGRRPAMLGQSSDRSLTLALPGALGALTRGGCTIVRFLLKRAPSPQVWPHLGLPPRSGVSIVLRPCPRFSRALRACGRSPSLFSYLAYCISFMLRRLGPEEA